MPKHKKTQSRPQTVYRIKNWSEYDKVLVQRGSLTFWLSDDFEQTWRYVGEKQRGSQFEYSEQAILLMLSMKEVFHLTNRGVEGFIRSVFQLLNVDLPVPDHSTLSKRGKSLKVNLPKKPAQSLNIVMDSTGLKFMAKANGRSACTASRSAGLGTSCMSGPIRTMAKSRPSS